MSSLERTTVELPEPPLIANIENEDSPTQPRLPGTFRPRWVVFALVLAVLLVFAIVYEAHRPKGNAIATFVVERTTFMRTLRLKGTTQAVQSRTIVAPMLAGAQVNDLVITRLKPAGAKVKRGDLLIEFDRQAQIKDALDKQALYQNFASQVAENQAQEDATRAKDETELKQAEDELKKDELEVRKNEISSKIDAEKNDEKLEEAKANLAQLRQTFDLKRRSARAAIQILALQRDKARDDMLHAQSNADKMQIVAPIDGVIVLHTTWRQETLVQVQEGDQVNAGAAILDVVDPSSMQVHVQANQEDIGDLHVGQLADVRLDAYPDVVFPSRLDELSPLGVASNMSSDLHYFIANFSVRGSSAQLMPDLSAAVDVEIERRQNAMVVPRESVITDGQDHYVWLKTSLGFSLRRVTVGDESDTQVVIASGVSPGDALERNPGEPETP